MKKVCLLLVLIAAACSGCLFPSHKYTPLKSYDLALIGNARVQNQFYVSAFGNDSPTRHRMLYRKNNNLIEQDPYNNWIQRPENMLSRYCSQMFPLAEKSNLSDLVEVRAVVNAFEFDLNSSEAVLGLFVTLRHKAVRKSFSINIREKVAQKTPEAFAAAMSRAAWQAGSMIQIEAGRFASGKK